MADWLCTICLWTLQNIQLRRLCHKNSWRAARIPKVLFTSADFVTLSFAFGLCRALAEILRRWSAHLFIYFNDNAPSMITASSVTRINATAHFISSNTRNVFKVLIFFTRDPRKHKNFFKTQRAHVSSVRYFLTKLQTASSSASSFIDALRDPHSPAKNLFHYSALAGTTA